MNGNCVCTTERVKFGIGKRIHDWRMERDISLHQVSVESKVAYSLLWELETVEGKTISYFKTVQKLAKYMKVSPAWLVYGVGDDE